MGWRLDEIAMRRNREGGRGRGWTLEGGVGMVSARECDPGMRIGMQRWCIWPEGMREGDEGELFSSDGDPFIHGVRGG